MAKENTASTKSLPTHEAFVIDGEGEKARWTRIGAAWPHQDELGFNVSLTAIPLSGRLVIRTRVEKEVGR
jgi:hypothetical protein